MPLQHASASVLRAMRRRGDATEYLNLIERIRSILPDVVLRTTVIAGFPGETRSDMNELLGFLEQARFDYVGVFPYSPEEGTEAADMPDQIPMRTRRARAQRLRDLADVIGFERVAERVGTHVEVLVEGTDEDEGFIAGRTRGQAPEIDGLVVLDKGVPGQVVRGIVVDAVGYDLEVEVDD
jgi:ribosomal protein S12 methylthiotransferase